MHSLPKIRLLMLLFVAVIAAACATTGPPVQEMSDARQAIAAAEEAGAGQLDSATLQTAETKLAAAEAQLQERMYRNARKLAISAKEAAIEALLRSRSLRDPVRDQPDGKQRLTPVESR